MAVALGAATVPLHAQTVVWDPGVTSTLVVQHQAQQEKLRDIKNNESAILVAQGFINEKMGEIKTVSEKMHARLYNVSSMVRQGNHLVYAGRIADDIRKYQGELVQYARKDPELLAVAYDAQRALVKRVADLTAYMGTVVIGGEANLLDNKQRQDIVLHVVSELRAMRGLAYGASRRMRLAARVGVFRTLSPGSTRLPNQDARIVEKLLKSL